MPTGFSLGPGATWHSAILNRLFVNDSECVYVIGLPTSPNDGAFCMPGLEFRRVMLHQVSPAALFNLALRLTDLTTNRTRFTGSTH